MTTELTIQVECTALQKQVSAMPSITTAEQCDAGNELLRQVKRLRGMVGEVFDSVVNATHVAWKAALAKRNEYDLPLKALDAKVRDMLEVYMSVRRAEEARQIAESKMREEARLKAERDAQTAALEAAGATVEAELLAAAPLPEPAVIALPSLSGASRIYWRWEVSDMAAIPREYLRPDDAAIGEQVQKLRQLTRIPGIRVYSTERPIVR